MKKIVVLFLISINLFAYVRLKNNQMINVFWGMDTVPITFKVNHYQQEVMTAIKAWEDPRSYLVFTMIAEHGNVYIDDSDFKNTIKLVESANTPWYYSDGTYSGGTYFDNFDPVVVAYTTTITDEYSRNPGKILDVDIVVALDRVEGLPHGMQHLTEILVHEMGHFIGLDHYCELNADLYKGIPACQPVNAAYVLKVPVMHFMPLDPRRIFLTDDDRAGLLSIYRISAPRRSGCGIFGTIDAGGSTGRFEVLFLLIPFMILLLFRKEFQLSKVRSKYRKK